MWRCLHVRLDRISKCYHISVRMVYMGVCYLYDTGLKEGIQQLGALRSLERWAEGP